MRIFFTLPVAPTAQRRFRIGRRGKFAGAYKDQAQEFNEASILALMFRYRPTDKLQGALALEISAFLKLPKVKEKAWAKKSAAGALTGADRPAKKPDIDNLIKQVMDCMTVAGFWEDDAQVVRVVAGKFYSDKPRWEIELAEID